MKLLILLVGLIVVANASDYEQWQDFKEKFSKSHKLAEDEHRYKIFQKNLRKIEYHNERYEKGEVSYFLKVTEFADKTSEEFQEMLKLQLPTEPNLKPIGTFKSESSYSRPDAIDWREKNAVTKVKNHGSSTSASSCLFGLSSEEQYPYEGVRSECRNNVTNKPISSMLGYVIVDRSEEEIAEAVASEGPISIYVNADSDWQLYGGGVFDHETCDDTCNYAALIVGYDAQAWTIKNSWGENWGENGYLRLIRGKNQCGITKFPVYPVL